jgi:two-component system CheB/CheR fusion protein
MAKHEDQELRRRAVAAVTQRRGNRPATTAKLVSELEIHRVELEMQNEELQHARIATEAALARYTEVFDFAPIGHVVLDADLRIREINHLGARLLGSERGRLIERPLAAFVAITGLTQFDVLMKKATASAVSVQDEFEMSRGDEAWLCRMTVASLARSEARVLVALEDITDAWRKQVALAQSERALSEANRHKDDFIAMLSHELRNPMASIAACVTALQTSDASADTTHRMLDILDRSSKHLGRLIDDLLDVTRITSGKIRLQLAPIELGELVSKVLADLGPGIERSGLRLEAAIAPGELWTLGDPVRLVQILTNLLANAQKFTPKGGRITVALERRDDRAVVRVTDTGVGVDPAQIDSMFEPFVQSTQGLDRSHGGLGLGLAVARGLVELHGGHIGMRSQGRGFGTEVSFDLPIETPNPTREERAAEPTVARRRILLVEDHADAAESLQLLLEMQGHEVQIASDGADALTMTRTFAPHIVLCDLGLPTMDGFEVARAMRADPALRHHYLIALSGYARPEDVERSREAGFDGHLAKPVSLAALLRAMQAANQHGR